MGYPISFYNIYNYLLVRPEEYNKTLSYREFTSRAEIESFFNALHGSGNFYAMCDAMGEAGHKFTSWGQSAQVLADLVDSGYFLVREVRPEIFDYGPTYDATGIINPGCWDLNSVSKKDSQEPDEPEEIELSFVEFQLFDQNNKPQTKEKYVLILPDQTEVEGRLSDDEYALGRLDDIYKGNCKFQFPYIEKELIDLDNKSFIEIQLVGVDGQPLKEEEVEITLQDGQIVTGMTDEEGVCRIEDSESGYYEVKMKESDVIDVESASSDSGNPEASEDTTAEP